MTRRTNWAKPNETWSDGRCPQPCGKLAYSTRRAAKAALVSHRRWGQMDMTDYRCPTSDAFHVGHRDARFVHPAEEAS